MNQEKESQNRFIFSDSFYEQLEGEKTEPKVSFDIPVIQSSNETIKTNDINLKVDSSISNNSESSAVINEKDNSKIEVETVKDESNTMLNSSLNNLISFNSTEEIVGEDIKKNIIEDSSNNFETVNSPVSLSNIDNTLNSQINLDVDSGINVALEQEIMKSKIESQSKIPVVENNTWLEKPSEKQVYRARRNAPPTIPSWIQDEIKKQDEQIRQQPSIEDTIIVPPVINIDELIKDSITDTGDEFDYKENDDMPIIKSTLLEELKFKEQQTNKLSILAHYGDDFCSKDYITNPAIGRDEEIKQLILILLTPEKSGILVGKPGIGKTSIVEGLAYQLQRNNVPDALKGYTIVSVKTTSLLGTLPNGEARLQILIDELKELNKIILFIDEIHMLMGATNESSLDFANMFKESLGRGSIKMIGATTNDEYERYILRDKAFVRRFQRVDVLEPTKEQTIKILMGTLPKIEKTIGAKLRYSNYIQTEIMSFIVDITTEYKRVYGIGSRYPDICLTLLSQAFSQAVFDNRKEVNIFDIRNAIENSKNIYPDVIKKELLNFDIKFKQIINEEGE